MLSTDCRLLSTWKQLSKRSNKFSSFLWTGSREEYSSEYLSKLRRFFYEFFIHYLFSPFQRFSLSAKHTRIIILKLRLHTLMVYCKLQLNLLLTILKLINPGKVKKPTYKSRSKIRSLVLVSLIPQSKLHISFSSVLLKSSTIATCCCFCCCDFLQ